MDALALVVAALALGFSIFSYFQQFGLQRRLAGIEEARRQDEVTTRQRADVTARFESFYTSRGHLSYRLVLLNRGLARAEDVTFELLDPEGNAPSLATQGHHFPIALDPDQDYSIVAAVVLGTPPSVDVVVQWTDEVGEQRKTLTLAVFGG